MVITRLSGGVGNQLFQYAAGRALAQRLVTELKLDPSPFGAAARKYELGAFRTIQTKATPEEVRRFVRSPESRLGRWLARLRTGSAVHFGEGYFRQQGAHFDERFLELEGDVYLDGYWQSERYFSDVASLIREEVVAEQPLGAEAMRWMQILTSCEAVSVHVRRGDYVSDSEVARVHGTCEPAYYDRGAALMARLVRDPVFFLFSDDPEYAGTISLPGRTHVVSGLCGHGADTDFSLMRLCRHHIIANSSYSWWAAWLASNPGKVVIAPRRWFKVPDFNTLDLIPNGWISV